LQFLENAVAHLGSGCLGESDGDDLCGVLHLGEQGEEAAGEEIGFAGACGGLNEDGMEGIEGANALLLIRRQSLRLR
jgi:hypothetical protein